MNRIKFYSVVAAVAVICVLAITLGLTLGGDDDANGSLSRSFNSSANVVEPTMLPANASQNPSISPSKIPSHTPSLEPTEFIADFEFDFNFTLFPSNASSSSPAPSINTRMVNSQLPSQTDEESNDLPRVTATRTPTRRPSQKPVVPTMPSPSRSPQSTTLEPSVFRSSRSPQTITSGPSMFPSTTPSFEDITGRIGTLLPTKAVNEVKDGTRFYAIGDVPYSNREARELQVQIDELQSDAEFLIHVGDIRSARDGRSCEIEEYYEVADILKKSHAPVFIVLGDNEWNDCPNINQGFDHWMTVFGKFDEEWTHDFNVIRLEARPENFAFVHKRTLFIGLNLVGGLLHHTARWEERLQDLYEWVELLVDSKVLSDQSDANSVVIFGHANPSRDHASFFDPLTEYMLKDKVSKVPFLYLNGDSHVWDFKLEFKERENFLRMQVEGSTREPPLQVTIRNSDVKGKKVSEVFEYDRMLPSIQV